MALFLDAGGPLILVYYGGVAAAGVFVAGALVFAGFRLVGWLTRTELPRDPEQYS